MVWRYFIDFAPEPQIFLRTDFQGFDLGFIRRFGYDDTVRSFHNFWDEK